MADIIKIATYQTVPVPVLLGSRQPITTSPPDVSAYDTLDLQIILHSLVGAGGIQFSLLTAMSNEVDDGSWLVAGTSGVITGVNLPDWGMVRIPDATTNSPLLRYVRWSIALQGLTTTATFSIVGLARRRM